MAYIILIAIGIICWIAAHRLHNLLEETSSTSFTYRPHGGAKLAGHRLHIQFNTLSNYHRSYSIGIGYSYVSINSLSILT